MLGKIEGKRRRGQQRMRWLDGITDFSGHESEHAPGVGDGQGGLVCCSPCVCVCSKSQRVVSNSLQSMGLQRVRQD